MKCPYCGSEFMGDAQYCPNCRQPLSRAGVHSGNPSEPVRDPRIRRKRWTVALIFILCFAMLCFGTYKVFFWVSNYRITRLYTRGEYTPTINQIQLDDGRIGHSIVFYGEDGDQVFLPELERSLSISGGTARISIADAEWFSGDVSEMESANVTLSPVLIDEKGMRTQLPTIDLAINVPESPLEVISPASDDLSIVTSRYELEFEVVPGSTVLVNGEDVTDIVDRNGLLSQNVNVYPVGDNIYTIIVQTPCHHETRREVKIHRQVFEIDVEVDASVSTISQTESTTIKGTIEPGANISVETAYIADSLIIDPNTGEFTFMAKLSTFGDNTVRFRVTKEGKSDAVVSLTVEYCPTAAVYASNAWAMNYNELKRLYEQWHGQVFQCKGIIMDIYQSEGIEHLVMDVGTTEQQLVILENHSAVAKPRIGQQCTALADVTGRSMYQNQYYPTLAARYIYYDE